MHEFGFRHLPIVEGKELRGLVSLRDIVLRQAAELERQGRRAPRKSTRLHPVPASEFRKQ